jgi:hypothetical protein
MPKVTITALPRQGYRGFGAIQRYFLSGQPETVDASDAEFAELTSEPASFFLKVEDAAEFEARQKAAEAKAAKKAAGDKPPAP